MSRPTSRKTRGEKKKKQAEGRAQTKARQPTAHGPAADILALQKMVGNRAVSGLLQAKITRTNSGKNLLAHELTGAIRQTERNTVFRNERSTRTRQDRASQSGAIGAGPSIATTSTDDPHALAERVETHLTDLIDEVSPRKLNDKTTKLREILQSVDERVEDRLFPRFQGVDEDFKNTINDANEASKREEMVYEFVLTTALGVFGTPFIALGTVLGAVAGFAQSSAVGGVIPESTASPPRSEAASRRALFDDRLDAFRRRLLRVDKTAMNFGSIIKTLSGTRDALRRYMAGETGARTGGRQYLQVLGQVSLKFRKETWPLILNELDNAKDEINKLDERTAEAERRLDKRSYGQASTVIWIASLPESKADILDEAPMQKWLEHGGLIGPAEKRDITWSLGVEFGFFTIIERDEILAIRAARGKRRSAERFLNIYRPA